MHYMNILSEGQESRARFYKKERCAWDVVLGFFWASWV